MSKEEFLFQLEQNLRKLPEVERVEAMEYYREYLEEAGESVYEVIKRLGSPKTVANEIIRECAVKSLTVVSQGKEQNQDTQRKKNNTAMNIWMIVLGIFAAPMAFPFAIAIIAVLFAFVVTLGAFWFSIAVLDVCFFVAGIAALVAGIYVAASSPVTMLFFFGSGLFLIGFGILAVILTVEITKLFIKAVSWLVLKIVKGGKKS